MGEHRKGRVSSSTSSAGESAAAGVPSSGATGAPPEENEEVGLSTPSSDQQQQSSRPFPHRPDESQLRSSIGLMVRNIPFGTRQEDLLELFSPYGEVVDIFIPWDRYLRRIRGFAFVRMQTIEQAEAAINALDGSTMRDRIIAVKRAEYERGEGPPSRRNSNGETRRGQGGRFRGGESRANRRRRPRSSAAGSRESASGAAQTIGKESGMATES